MDFPQFLAIMSEKYFEEPKDEQQVLRDAFRVCHRNIDENTAQWELQIHYITSTSDYFLITSLQNETLMSSVRTTINQSINLKCKSVARANKLRMSQMTAQFNFV